MSPRASALAALVSGLAVIGLSFVFISMDLRSAEPLNGAYADQAILAFELARTPEELARVIGANPPDAAARSIRAAMDRANRVDFAYMALYGVFIAFACACAAQVRQRRWLLLGVALGPLAALADLLENLALLQLTQPDAQVGPLLEALRVRTLLKWELLAATTALFAAGFIGGSRLGSVAGAILVLLAVMGGALTLVDPARFLVVLSSAITLAWLWQLGYVALALRRLGRGH
jgi:hypothetical protein